MSLAAILRPREVRVAVGPLRVTVQPGWADDWLIALEGQRLDTVIPGMVGQTDRDELADALVSCQVTMADIADGARSAIAEAAGRPWWEVVRLVAYSAAQEGQIVSALALEGIWPDRVTIGLWCTAVVAYVLPRLDEMKRMQFEADLRIPPGGSVRDLRGFDAVQF